MDEDSVRKIVTRVVERVLAENSPKQKFQVAIGSDHGGYSLKEELKPFLKSLGYQVTDVGVHSQISCDYPYYAKKVATLVQSGECERGIMIDGAGIGSSMVCNRFRGVRAALCYDMRTILNSRQHNNANVLTLGAPTNTPADTKKLVETWLATDFEGGRHQRRVDQIELDAQNG